ncbi:MAG: Gfo/Idh/MocA family oxidoreductase [Caldilineaceae bacterium]|nr:Gfo/Idh/MocA family oxidoreductase [Caldilineaceae bacterium]
MKKLRVAVVGMGIGRPNGLALAHNPRAEVVALCDLVEERMNDFASLLPQPDEVRLYTDFDELCRSREIDAIFIGTPNQLHVPMGLKAVAHDKHVLVTKPLADSVAAAEQLVETAETAGVVNMMSLSTRFSAEIQYMGALARQGIFGDLYYARARSVRRSGIPSWNLGFIREGGGAFRDMGVHVLDSAWWLLGMPRPLSVTGVAGAKFGPRGFGYFGRKAAGETSAVPESYYSQFAADDYAGGFIRFEDGSALQVESFWASHQPGDLQIELFGDEAGAQVRPPTLYTNGPVPPAVVETAKEFDAVPQAGRSLNDESRPLDITFDGLTKEKSSAWNAIADHFISCILDGIPCEAPLRHGLTVQEMMEGLLSSAGTGRELRLDDVKVA